MVAYLWGTLGAFESIAVIIPTCLEAGQERNRAPSRFNPYSEEIQL